jgi:hypothetical protein
MTNTLITAKWAQRELNRMVTRHIERMQSPTYQKWLAERKATWMARPWYERRWLTFKNAQLPRLRERLGEIIAGRRFDDND